MATSSKDEPKKSRNQFGRNGFNEPGRLQVDAKIIAKRVARGHKTYTSTEICTKHSDPRQQVTRYCKSGKCVECERLKARARKKPYGETKQMKQVRLHNELIADLFVGWSRPPDLPDL